MTDSDLDASLWAYFTYYGEGRFDHWEDGSYTDGVAFGVKFLDDGTQLIAHEGSHDALDWWRNFQVRLMQHPTLGGIDAGLFAGNDRALPKVKAYLDKDKPVRLYGHSRGGSNAIYTGAMLICGGYKVTVRAFNPPRTQHQSSRKLSEIYAGQDIAIIRTDCDPVSLEPPGYTHPVEPETFTVAPVSCDPELEMRFHHVHLNVIGMALKERGFCAVIPS